MRKVDEKIDAIAIVDRIMLSVLPSPSLKDENISSRSSVGMAPSGNELLVVDMIRQRPPRY